jgi:hypothetical protein
MAKQKIQPVLDAYPDQSWEKYIEAKPSKASYYATSMLKKLQDMMAGIGALSYSTKKGETRDISRFEKYAFNLLSDGSSNAKTKKNTRPTKILYMSPASKSGVNFCPMASPGCIWSCLNLAGRGVMKNVQDARFDRSQFLINFEKMFMEKIAIDIKRLVKNKAKMGEEVAVRLNGTSDIPIVEMMYKAGLLKDIPTNVRFYDYTKFPQNAGVRKIGKHTYVVAYSRAENYFDKATGKIVDNTKNALQLLDQGKLVAAVFAGKTLPKYWFGYRVIDGDERDDLMLDIYKQAKPGAGIVLGLRAKGARTKDKKAGGFVITCDDLNDCRNS